MSGANVFWGSAGLAEDPEFSADEIAGRFATRAAPFFSRLEAFGEAAKNPFLQAMARMHRLQPDQYKLIRELEVNLTVVFVGMEAGNPFVGVVYFKAKHDASGTPVDVDVWVNFCPGTLCRTPPVTGPYWWIFGRNDAAIRLIRNSFQFWSADVASDARRLIQEEIDDVPSDVGPPIDVLQIDGTGSRWIAPYGTCYPSPKSQTPRKKKK